MTDRDRDDVWEALEKSVSRREIEEAIQEADQTEVVCRECGHAIGQINGSHVQTHGISLSEYERRHPDAPIYPEDPDMQPGREPGFKHSEETKREIGEGNRDLPRVVDE